MALAAADTWITGAIMDAVTVWRRPYRDPFRIWSGLIALTGSAFACVMAVALFVAHWTDPWARVPAALFVTVWLTFAWRMHRSALVISDSGVRVRWLLKTRTMSWREITGFRFGVDIMAVDRLWIDLADGRRIRTPVQRVRSRLFGSQLHDGGTWLLRDAAEDLLRTLGQELQTRQGTA